MRNLKCGLHYVTDSVPSAKLSVTVMEPSMKTHSWISKLRSPFWQNGSPSA
jgi:hypothetical protein